MDKQTRDYIEPLARSVLEQIKTLHYRMNQRGVLDAWTKTDFVMAAAAAESLARSANWIVTALDVIQDVKAGAINEDRESGAAR